MSWMQDELAITEAEKKLNAITWLKWEDKAIKDIEIDFSIQFIKEKDGFGKLQAKIPVKENNEFKIWGLYPNNPVYYEILKAGNSGKTKFKILMQKMKKTNGIPGNAFTILEAN